MATTGSTPFSIERFARVYTKGPEELPAQADTYHNPERGWYFKLHLDGIATRDAQPVVEKAADHFVVELVERMNHGEVYKERVYVEDASEVPEGFKVHTGPKGGLYYETGVQRVGTGDGEARDVAVIHWDDVEEGDDIVYETPEGEETFAEIVSIEERGDRADVIYVSIDGESQRAMPGTYTVDKSEGVYLPRRLEKQWVPYEGPQGGKGWRNRKTGEIRYQEDSPAVTEGEDEEPESTLPDADPSEPPGEGWPEGWTDAPPDLDDLDPGQAIEYHDGESYYYGEVIGEGFDDGVIVETESGATEEVSADEITAVEEQREHRDAPDIEFVETTPEAFNQSVRRKIEEEPRMGAFLTEHDPEEFADYTLLSNEEGTVGAAVSPEGDIQNVFALRDAPGGAGQAVMEEAIEQGGITLDCYDGYLRDFYDDLGFRETGRMEFNPEFAPEAFDIDKYGHPDVVFMHLDPEATSGRLSEVYYEPDEWGRAKEDARGAADTGRGGGDEGRGVRGGERGPDSGPGAAGRRPEIVGEPSPVLEELAEASGFEAHREIPEHLHDILGETELEADIEFEPRDPSAEEGNWSATPGTPKHAHPGSYGDGAIDVTMSVDDFADLQEYIGTKVAWDEHMDAEEWWGAAREDDVNEYADILLGETEPADFSADGLPIPFIEIGNDGQLRGVQEGRHRTLAAQAAGLDEIPVRFYYRHDREGKAPLDLQKAAPRVIDLAKQEDTWTYYYGPSGGEGWINVVTGEIRYQQQRPGEAPEGGDGYGDWMDDDWEEPPGDLDDLAIGQAVEFQDHNGEYQEGEYAGVNEQGYHAVEYGDGKVAPVGDEMNEVTAVEGDYSLFNWSNKDNFSSTEDYWEAVSTDPADADDWVQEMGIEVGDEVTMDTHQWGELTVEVSGFWNGENQANTPVVHWEDLPEEPKEDMGYNDPPFESLSPTVSTGPDVIAVNGEYVEGEEPEEEPEGSDESPPSAEEDGSPIPDDWAEVESTDELSEGDDIMFISGGGAVHDGEVKIVDDEGVLTDDDKWAFPETMDVFAPPEESDEGGILDDIEGEFEDEPSLEDEAQEIVDVMEGDEEGAESPPEDEEAEADPTGPDEDEMDDAVAEPAPEDAGGDGSPTADYDMEQYDESDVEEWGSLADFGFPGGITAHAMSVGALPHYDAENESPENNAGLVFKTEFGEGPDGAKPDLGLRQMVTHDVGQALGARMPQHTGHPDEEGWVAAEGVDGKMAQDVEPGVVDEDDFMEQAAKQVILGNNDAHAQNVLVDPSGDVWAIDIDHSGGDMMDGFVGNKTWYGDAIDRATGELVSTAQSLGLDVSQQDIVDRAQEVAQQYVDDETVSDVIFEAAQNYDVDLAQNVENNLQNFADGAITLEEEL